VCASIAVGRWGCLVVGRGCRLWVRIWVPDCLPTNLPTVLADNISSATWMNRRLPEHMDGRPGIYCPISPSLFLVSMGRESRVPRYPSLFCATGRPPTVRQPPSSWYLFAGRQDEEHAGSVARAANHSLLSAGLHPHGWPSRQGASADCRTRACCVTNTAPKLTVFTRCQRRSHPSPGGDSCVGTLFCHSASEFLPLIVPPPASSLCRLPRSLRRCM
jgi:hypothetical protein